MKKIVILFILAAGLLEGCRQIGSVETPAADIDTKVVSTRSISEGSSNTPYVKEVPLKKQSGDSIYAKQNFKGSLDTMIYSSSPTEYQFIIK